MLARPMDAVRPEDADKFRQQFQEMLKEFQEQRIGKQGTQPYLDRIVNNFEVQTQGRSPLEKAAIAMNASLTLKALSLLRDVDSFAGIDRDSELFRLNSLAQLLIRTGELEELRATLDGIEANIAEVPPDRAESIRGVFRPYRVAMQTLSGEFNAAIQELEGMARVQRQQNDLQIRALAGRAVLARASTIPVVSAIPLGNPQSASLLDNVEAIQQRLEGEAAMNLRIALVALERGDNDTAVRLFQQALRPRGLDINFADRTIAMEYFRVLKANR